MEVFNKKLIDDYRKELQSLLFKSGFGFQYCYPTFIINLNTPNHKGVYLTHIDYENYNLKFGNNLPIWEVIDILKNREVDTNQISKRLKEINDKRILKVGTTVMINGELNKVYYITKFELKNDVLYAHIKDNYEEEKCVNCYELYRIGYGK